VSIPSIYASELKQLHLFSSLDKNQLEKVLNTTEIKKIKTGETLFERTQKADSFYMVRTGSIKLFLLSSEGAEKVIEILRPGQYCAEAIMFMEQQIYPVSAQALENSEVFIFNNLTYLNILEVSFPTNRRLLAQISMKMHRQLAEIDNLCLHNATYRLVNYIINNMPEEELENNSTFHFPSAKNIIAKRLSIQGETFSRILYGLRKKGLIEVNGSDVKIMDLDGLKELLH